MHNVRRKEEVETSSVDGRHSSSCESEDTELKRKDEENNLISEMRGDMNASKSEVYWIQGADEVNVERGSLFNWLKARNKFKRRTVLRRGEVIPTNK